VGNISKNSKGSLPKTQVKGYVLFLAVNLEMNDCGASGGSDREPGGAMAEGSLVLPKW